MSCFDPDAALVDAAAQRRAAGGRARARRAAAANGRAPASSPPTLADLGRCDVVYIAPDVPTDDAGRSDLARHPRADRRRSSRRSGRDALLVVLCQVPPGFTRGTRAAAGAALLSGRDADLRPRRRARDAARSATSSAAPIPPRRCHAPTRALLDAFGCPILPMRYESAELAKISINAAWWPRSASPTRWRTLRAHRRRLVARSCRR